MVGVHGIGGYSGGGPSTGVHLVSSADWLGGWLGDVRRYSAVAIQPGRWCSCVSVATQPGRWCSSVSVATQPGRWCSSIPTQPTASPPYAAPYAAHSLCHSLCHSLFHTLRHMPSPHTNIIVPSPHTHTHTHTHAQHALSTIGSHSHWEFTNHPGSSYKGSWIDLLCAAGYTVHLIDLQVRR